MDIEEIKWEEISSDMLIDTDKLQSHFKEYLIENLDYSDDEASLVAEEELKDAYESDLVSSLEYECRCYINGVHYEVYQCEIDLSQCGLIYAASVEMPDEPFRFCMLVELNTLVDETVGAYIRASKKYLTDYD